jgi:hypothetical protein
MGDINIRVPICGSEGETQDLDRQINKVVTIGLICSISRPIEEFMNDSI